MKKTLLRLSIICLSFCVLCFIFTACGANGNSSTVNKSTSAVDGSAGTTISKKYTITWKNYDGTILETDTNVEYGVTPHYDGQTPTKVSDTQYDYTFSGWTPTIQTVKGNTTYTAEYVSKSLFDICEVQDGWAIEKYNGNASRITIPSEINGKTIVEIADKAFYENTKLLAITLPNSILRIGDHAFYKCSRLGEFKNSDNCQSVGRMCLAGTSIKEITIPESLISFGAFWTLLSPIEKIIIKGDRDTTKFVGNYLGSAYYAIVNFYDGANSLEDHFNSRMEWMSMGTMNYWVLKDGNRFFNYTANVLGKIETIKVFANDSSNSYYYTTSSTKGYEKQPDGTTFTHVYETVDSMSGNFYLSLDKLKTIEISSKSNIDKSVLLGRLENVTIQEYDN